MHTADSTVGVLMATKVWGDDKERTCPLCGQVFRGMGNNPEPLAEFEERCCDDCNTSKVIPARLNIYLGDLSPMDEHTRLWADEIKGDIDPMEEEGWEGRTIDDGS